MTNKQWKLNAHFYKDFELVVVVAAGSTIIHETVSNLYFWLDIAMILLGIVTLVDSMILHRKQIKN